MRTIYIDEDFKCYLSNDGKMTAVETDFFNGKCEAFIEGYRFIPAGETWVRGDGVPFRGEMIAPWKPFAELEKVQRDHERQLLEEYAGALKVLGVTV